ncbi:MAG: helix-turn-helix transcriptional regulator [Salegentibacter sp.]|uniref:helix-turn-helix domain-containing protein n=1 Tax=Salegentibacter sp. TaxID=1903072 RepID=UPI002870966F|nr:helix-turn-helix transcriptional regulator [Salegentibacter sp.]MDR9458273.1 helix-turn-helix transcriptional regulator [Salegentibacter sp.]
MYYSADKELDQIASLITALANGEYEKRINISHFKERYLTIAVLLNMLAGELKYAYPGLSPETNTKYLNHLIIFFDRKLNILDYNTDFISMVKSIRASKIDSIIDKPSLRAIEEIIRSEKFETPLNLNFSLEGDLITRMNSRVTRLTNNKDEFYILSAVKTITLSAWDKEKLQKEARNPKTLFNISKNKHLIDRLLHYLLDHLDSPLPPIAEIATTLNTNPTLLKRGFKLIHGTTIAQFHREKRLEKARDLILDNDTPLIAIADQCGFKSISHFSRAFKKHFGVNPSKTR